MKGITSLLAVAATALTLTACSGDAPPAQASSSASGVAASLPDGLFLTEAPAGAPPLSQARAAAATGDTITFTGYIGGRVSPFTESRAIFVMADSVEAPQCTDGCPVPFDACCTPGDVIAANSVTVQVVDATGQPLRIDLNGVNGLAGGKEVTITGTVREANEAFLLVDASGIALNAP